MSLIVARKEGNQLCIVSDTKLTYPAHETRNHKTSPEEGVIKTVILNSQLAVAFAGDIDFAEKALQQINGSIQLPAILHILKQHHDASCQQTDFVVCQVDPDPVIYKIANGQCSEEEFAGLGDLKAYGHFQRCMQSNPKDTLSKKKTSPHAKLSYQDRKKRFSAVFSPWG